jgi:release factor glutamine methyltransferase
MELMPDEGFRFGELRRLFEDKAGKAFSADESRAMLRLLWHLEWPEMQFPRFADDWIPAVHGTRMLIVGERLSLGEPLQYILGKAPFLEHVFDVGPGVLIPRPETEELYAWIAADYTTLPQPAHIADIGCGSGCLAVSLAGLFPAARVSAVDVSTAALDYTSRNADRILSAGHRLQCLELDFLLQADALPPADLLVSNPPYIASDAMHEVDAHVQQHEPHVALYAPGSDALIFYRRLAEQLGRQESGRVYCEINPHYAAETCALFEALPGVEVMLRKDITGKDRMIRGIKKAP